MSKLKINFIGAGNLGKTIAKLIADKNAGIILGICNSNIESSDKAVNFIGQGLPYKTIEDLPEADVVFITVPDDKIETTCRRLSSSKNFNPSGIFIHCSGLLSSDALKPAKFKGGSVLSIHPMRSFADPSISVHEFHGTFCAMEGDVNAQVIGKEIFTKIGGKIIAISKHKKGIYHTSGVISSNYLVSLADNAIKCLREAGLNNEDSTDIILNMMQGTIKNLTKTRSPEKALTGPIKRGDVGTIRAHISSIDDSITRKLYTILGEATLRITNHNQAKKESIKRALDDEIQCQKSEISFIKAKL